MASKSKVSAFIAKNMGKIQGEIEARIQSELIKMLEDFSNECPSVEKLNNIVNTANNLMNAVNNFKKTVKRFERVPKTLEPGIKGFKRLIQLLKKELTPLAIGVKPAKDFGGLISAKRAGSIVSKADRLAKYVKYVEDLEDDVASINKLIKSTYPSIELTEDFFNNLKEKIEACANSYQEKGELGTFDITSLDSISAENFGGPGSDPSKPVSYRSLGGVDYNLSIVQVSSDTDVAPRRQAIAKDNRNVIVLKGAPSYSSSTKILLDELKFRIDNQLP